MTVKGVTVFVTGIVGFLGIFLLIVWAAVAFVQSSCDELCSPDRGAVWQSECFCKAPDGTVRTPPGYTGPITVTE